MDFRVRDIPHEEHRYGTVGDWTAMGRALRDVLVSRMVPEDYSFAIAVHEMVEAWLCLKRGVTDEQVTAFDVAFEGRRDPDDESEPGDSPEAPYHREHVFATKIERMLIAELGLDWSAYEEAINSL